MIELGVNIDHVATLRQARRTWEPDPVWAAVEAHLGGADGITVHLREDRRHINDSDVRRLRELTQVKLNLEMGATDEMVDIACALKPEMAMLVPEGRHEVTTEGGLDVLAQEARLADVVGRLADAGIVTSVFIDAELPQIEAAARIGARVCEIHTGPYAHAFHDAGRDAESPAVLLELDKVRRAGEAACGLGMRFNAGHALNYYNVEPIARLAGVRELHIGHAIVSRSVFIGLRAAVAEMKRLIREAATTIAATDPDFAAYLRLRSRDLLSDDYEAGDAAWVSGELGNLNAQIGSYETYDDELYGVKAFYGLSLLVRDRERSAKLAAAISGLQAIEDGLPYDRRKSVRARIPVGVYQVVADFGQARGTNTATILPNDPDPEDHPFLAFILAGEHTSRPARAKITIMAPNHISFEIELTGLNRPRDAHGAD